MIIIREGEKVLRIIDLKNIDLLRDLRDQQIEGNPLVKRVGDIHHLWDFLLVPLDKVIKSFQRVFRDFYVNKVDEV